MTGRADTVSLVAGLAVAGLGALLWLDQEGTLDLTLTLFAALASAVVGVILVASGLANEATAARRSARGAGDRGAGPKREVAPPRG